MGFPKNFKNSKIYNKFMNCIILILIMISFTIIMICRIKMDFIKSKVCNGADLEKQTE